MLVDSNSLYITFPSAALRRHVLHATLPAKAEETAEFVEKANELFDLFNGFGHSGDRKRPIWADDLPNALAVR